MSTVFIRLIIIYFITVFSIRLMGKRQVGEMQMSELVTAFFLSELASYPVTNQNVPLTYGIIPVLTLVCVEVILSFLSTKFTPLHRALDSPPSALIAKGKLSKAELARARLSMDELLSELRLKDVARLEDVDYALLEGNGKISVIPKGGEGLQHLLIADGVTNTRGLAGAGLSEEELTAFLARRSLRKEDVFLLCRTDRGTVTLLLKEDV